MHNHFDQYLNLKKWILNSRPKIIVECGAGKGELTKKLVSLMDIYPFKLVVINDQVIGTIDDRIDWRIGVSYKILPTIKNIGFCIIDTDHNFWTLMQELKACKESVEEDGHIALHDVATFYHDSGMAMSYWQESETYPKEEIEKYLAYGGIGDALIDFLQTQKMFFKLIQFNSESNGAALIKKKTQKEFYIYGPGKNPVFAKEELCVA